MLLFQISALVTLSVISMANVSMIRMKESMFADANNFLLEMGLNVSQGQV